jgi:lysyl-tRNA synthetase, class II
MVGPSSPGGSRNCSGPDIPTSPPVVRQRDLAPETLAEAVRAADAFRDCATERGFSMALSRLGDLRDGDCLLVLCRDTEFRIRGVLQFVPWGPHGLSLDVMRGDGTAVNGLMELMVVSGRLAQGLGDPVEDACR